MSLVEVAVGDWCCSFRSDVEDFVFFGCFSWSCVLVDDDRCLGFSSLTTKIAYMINNPSFFALYFVAKSKMQRFLNGNTFKSHCYKSLLFILYHFQKRHPFHIDMIFFHPTWILIRSDVGRPFYSKIEEYQRSSHSADDIRRII